jgi:tetratricopeptide (TPR) repeat protein
MSMRRIVPLVSLAVLFSALAPGAGAAVKGTVYLEDGSKDVNLLGVSEGVLRYSFTGGGAASQMPLEKIRRVRIRIEYDRSALRKYLARQNYGAAAATLVKPLLPCLPFLQVPDNNQTPAAMDALTLLMRAAEERMRVGDAKAKREAVQQYRVAQAFARAIAQADWYEGAEEAACRAIACMVALGEREKAREEIEGLAVPSETDPAIGWHALARAQLLYEEESWEQALEAAAESVAFETKDFDSFPGALLVSARCYEKLDEWHRARDIYHAMGRLLRNTTWEVHAIARLRHIMDEGLTKEEEKQELHDVFFSGKIDYNAEARELIEQYAERQRGKEEDDK